MLGPKGIRRCEEKAYLTSRDGMHAGSKIQNWPQSGVPSKGPHYILGTKNVLNNVLKLHSVT